MCKIINYYLRKKTPKQAVTFNLFICFFAVNIFACICRLCGFNWFYATILTLEPPSRWVELLVMSALLYLELIFWNLILYNIKKRYVFIISLIEVGLMYISDNRVVDNLILLFCVVILPAIIQRNIKYSIKSIIVYLIILLYSAIFLVGRIGNIPSDGSYNFCYNVMGALDYKLFIIVLYLFYINWGYLLWEKFLKSCVKSKG
jgi:hypothetical protein